MGAVLLADHAVRVALDLLTPADFYDAGHRDVFGAVGVLHAEGGAVDPVSVGQVLDRAGQLGRVGGRPALSGLQSAGGVSAHAAHYAGIVAGLSAHRRAIRVAGELAERAYSADGEGVSGVVDGAASVIAGPGLTSAEPGVEAQVLAETRFEHRWLVPHLLERRDRAILVGPEGWGKSLLLRQIAVCVAAGLHPFTLCPFAPSSRVLLVDLENAEAAVSRSLGRLLERTGGRYAGTLWVRCRPQGLDLRSRRDARWLDALCAHHRPDMLVLGPLYKAYRGSVGQGKSSEEAAEETAAALDEIRVRHDVAVLIEAHAPHGESGDRAGWRPRGSTLWLGWPEVGVGMKPLGGGAVRLVHWRGARDREAGRAWPNRLVEGPSRSWPWIVPADDMEAIA